MYGRDGEGVMWSHLHTMFVAAGAAVVLSAGTAWVSYTKGRADGAARVQALWNAEQAAVTARHMTELAKARQQEQSLRDLADKLRKEKADEVRRMSRQHAADLERVRNRPEARAADSGGVPEGATAGVGCTGAGLARLDAELLTGYAHAAARLQLAYDECAVKYDAVRRALSVETPHAE